MQSVPAAVGTGSFPVFIQSNSNSSLGCLSVIIHAELVKARGDLKPNVFLF